MVHTERLGRGPVGSVFGAVPSALPLGLACEMAESREGLIADGAGRLAREEDHRVLLMCVSDQGLFAGTGDVGRVKLC